MQNVVYGGIVSIYITITLLKYKGGCILHWMKEQWVADMSGSLMRRLWHRFRPSCGNFCLDKERHLITWNTKINLIS